MYTTNELKQLIEKETGNRLNDITLMRLINRSVISRPAKINCINIYNLHQANRLVEYFNAVPLTLFVSKLKSQGVEISYMTLKRLADAGELPIMANVSPYRIPESKLQEAIAIVRKKYVHVPREYALEYINELRGHMTQAEMSKELGVSESYISHIVNGTLKVTSDFYERLSKLANKYEKVK
jgi:hypothetical protein